MGQVKGFIFNYGKCVGCHACMVACFAENSTKPPLSWRQVNHYNKEKLPLLGFVHLSIACNHCNEAQCKKACPSGAYSIDNETLAVIHNPEKCIGCKYCTWACPFDAPKYNPFSGVIEKCNFCNHKLKEGSIPACALNCPTGALSFGDIEESSHPESFGLSTNKIYPRIKILGSEVKDSIPMMDNSASGFEPKDIQISIKQNVNQPINANAEWPLAIFTLIGAFITGWLGATVIHNSISIPFWLFGSLGIMGMLLSVLHLGKPFRSYLSIINLKSSWLSREILLFGLFIGLGTFSLWKDSSLLIICSSIVGFAFLFSVEMVYSITVKKYKTIVHSSNTIITALVFAALFSQSWGVLVGLLGLKSLLFIVKNGSTLFIAGPIHAITTLARLCFGLIAPLYLLSISSINHFWILSGSIIIGEIIDRFMYYNDIEAERPFSKSK